MSLISLVYVSYATTEMTDGQLLDLLNESRDNNKTIDVTGMLLHRDGFFIQALEGEEDVVMNLYETIKDDPRHKNVLAVYRNHIDERAFGDWSMGFNKVSDADLSRIEGYRGTLDADFLMEDHSRAERLLSTFSQRGSFF